MTHLSEAFNVVVCASGGGGNFQALIDASPALGINISNLLVDRKCGAIDRAISAAIPYSELRKTGDKAEFVRTFVNAIPRQTNLIVLAGFMPILPKEICAAWNGKIINTHPSLLPKYGGKGMYGVRVQEAVIAAGETQAGCTVHFVNETIDGGAIILQKAIDVIDGESPWQLGGRVHLEETKLLVEAVRRIKTATVGTLTEVQNGV